MKTKLILTFFCMLGFSRMALSLGELEYKFPWFQALAPSPRVFVNENYFENNFTRFIFDESNHIDIDFNKNLNWPFKNNLLLGYYPLLRILDRSNMVEKRLWNKYIDYFICQQKGDVFTDEFLIKGIRVVESYHLALDKQWKQVQRFSCQ